MNIHSKFIDRVPVASGRFYTAHAEKLEIEIKNMLEEARQSIKTELPDPNDLLALIAPHAGYVFSGIVAASAFLQLEKIKPRKKIFLLGSSHHTDFNGASIYNQGDYITPFGKVKVDIELANKLISKSDTLQYVNAAHAHEHSIEVMLPFIQLLWGNNFEIIPIIIATHNPETSRKIAEVLLPYFNHSNLFVISTDLSHYPEYEDAKTIDSETTKSVLTGEPENLLSQLDKNRAKYIHNLSTSMCGWTSVISLMYITKKLTHSTYKPLLYQNSGDAKIYGERDRVVGYQSFAIYQTKEIDSFRLTNEDKKDLINTAKKSIFYYLQKGEKFKPLVKKFSKSLQTHTGAFVSLYSGDELRGCIGRIQAGNTSLVEVVSESAVSAAFYDSRFTPVTLEELDDLNIEISILTPLQRIHSIEEIELGKHGIFIKKDFHTGTFLPQVAEKTNWTVEEFLGHCAKNKAGLAWDDWKEAELYIYEAIISDFPK